MNKKARAIKILATLKEAIPGAQVALDFKNPLELLVATILSAQCTDARVNKTTPALFKRFTSASDYAKADVKEIEALIGSINFFKNKARSLQGCGEILEEKFFSTVPGTLDDLIKLPGVGRKTANVVLAGAFNIPALAVDTHVRRVAARLGLTKNTDPDKIEADLTSIYPPKSWTMVTTLFILHGRSLCKARNPRCSECSINKWCEFPKTNENKRVKANQGMLS
jgi:endonuclease-3